MFHILPFYDLKIFTDRGINEKYQLFPYGQNQFLVNGANWADNTKSYISVIDQKGNLLDMHPLFPPWQEPLFQAINSNQNLIHIDDYKIDQQRVFYITIYNELFKEVSREPIFFDFIDAALLPQ